MLMRDSKYKGASSYSSILALARASKGKDEEGYRAEFIRMVEMAELLSGGKAVKNYDE
jgi:Ca-activated chloride channel family protein